MTLRLTGLGPFYATKLCGVEKHKDLYLDYLRMVLIR